MAFVLYPSHTEKRQRWLEVLYANPGTNRDGFGVVPYQCMRLDWTEWTDDVMGERLTDAGLAKLNEWKEQAPNAELRGGDAASPTRG
jgi:hypothetical protein